MRAVTGKQHIRTLSRRAFGAAMALAMAALLFAPLASCGSTGVASSGEGAAAQEQGTDSSWHNADLGCGWSPTGSVELSHARNFSIDRYEGGYELVCIADGTRFLSVPEGSQAPEGIADDIVVAQQPLDNIYMVAANIVCLFDALDAIGSIGVSGILLDHCPIDSFNDAMESGSIIYAGKYNAPDYETVLESGTSLAVESTMINHSPEVKEKLQNLGVNVLVDQSSYESEALGRLEWIKLYGALLGKDDLAANIFDEQVAQVEQATNDEPTGKTVAFFYINSNGAAVTRKSGDYVPQMIRLAGGEYIFGDLDDDSATSTVTLEMEDFYATAKDADVVIYNATVDGGVASLDDLVAKNPLLANFKAVQNGDVWCTDQDMYQQMTNTGTIVADMHRVLTEGHDAQTTFLSRLQ
ncbi:MAG: ABC transporter substrate-binding protein [Eggerthellaceae bacterium]|nr:ABC transporter substrate-binding protein [Eggerthellaceae bacterium]